MQLFSAIEKHKTMMQVKLSQCRSIMGREKVLESTGKEAFLDILKQQGKRVKEETEPEGKVKKEEEDLVKEVSDTLNVFYYHDLPFQCVSILEMTV